MHVLPIKGCTFRELLVKMLLDKVLDPPSYGWADQRGALSKPTTKQILREFFKRLNIFRSRKNWLPLFSWLRVIVLIPLLFLFIFKFFSIGLLLIAFVYSMIIMGTHGTIWHHRYCTHKAYEFKNRFWRILTQNLTISMIPEEIYAISHHVHHAKSDQPGDPYNANGGFLYCFLADVNHQPISKDLTTDEYSRTIQLMSHTGVQPNSYNSYQKWGSIVHPGRALLECTLNWTIWYAIFYLIGGHGLACALFGAAAFWAVGVRTFNYEGHGKGEDKRRKGYDFNEKDMSINQLWPGIVAGEWHNNHHLYPRSARSGFLVHQIDLAWYYIKFLHFIGGVTSYHDSKASFLEKYANKAIAKEVVN
ncbi:stearoyl-CoA desaturase (delta-9 desaturase) [Olivibacter domesticus]|uniref:Stearoyl-CoA desaturase (Delta-9 desaturase) n=2 Tax=Olivibacter domesticus TaxID=407022 RepID=A0A1H7JBL9_OLID1|nr:stearoyl-CoA desaturase (delta-9 desaturase) [Olivibacter domesticus]